MPTTSKLYKTVQDKLDEYVNTHGMRASQVRNMVLEQACLLPQPFKAEQLVEACKAERISVGTVYNSLNLFLLARILYAINRQRGKSATEYEVTAGANSRMQVICCRCGRLTEFHDKAVERLVREHGFANFNVRRFSLFVYGECKLCRRLIAKERKGK